MRRQSVLEKGVVTRIMTALQHIPGVVVRKRHGTAMGVAGDPDLYGSFNGRHFEIEVKRPNDPSSQLTKLQETRLLQWKGSRALIGVARCVDDALTILGLNPPDPRWICSGCREYRWQGDAPARCPNCGHRHFDQEPM